MALLFSIAKPRAMAALYQFAVVPPVTSDSLRSEGKDLRVAPQNPDLWPAVRGPSLPPPGSQSCVLFLTCSAPPPEVRLFRVSCVFFLYHLTCATGSLMALRSRSRDLHVQLTQDVIIRRWEWGQDRSWWVGKKHPVKCIPNPHRSIFYFLAISKQLLRALSVNGRVLSCDFCHNAVLHFGYSEGLTCCSFLANIRMIRSISHDPPIQQVW